MLFPAHIRPGDERNTIRAIVQIQVVRNKPPGLFARQPFNYRMAAAPNPHLPIHRERRSTVAIFRRHLRQCS